MEPSSAQVTRWNTNIIHLRYHNKAQSSFESFNNTHYTALAFLLACLIPNLTRQSALRRGLLLLQILFTLLVFIAPPPSDISNTAVLYTAGVLSGNLLARYLDRLYLRIPEQDFFRLVHDPLSNTTAVQPKTEVATKQLFKEDATSLIGTQKLFWTFELLTVTRGIGWNWRVTGIPSQPAQLSRVRFVQSCLARWVAMYTSLHLFNMSCCAMLTSFPSIRDPCLRATLVSLASNTIFLYTFLVLGWAVTIYSHFALLMLPLSMACVGMRVGPKAWQEPESWPPNFGSFKDAYSIRRFWGHTWHQQMRRTTSVPGVFLLSLLPLSFQKSRALLPRLLKRYFLLFAAFFVSGLIHAAGSYNVTRTLGLPHSDGGEIGYFLLQGVAIMVEDFVLWVLRVDFRTGPPSRTRRILGYSSLISFYILTRVKFKAVSLAAAHGIQDERGELFAALELVRRGLVAVPGNFVAAAFGKHDCLVSKMRPE